MQRLVRILDHGQAAGQGNGAETGAAVVQVPRQHDSHDALPERCGRGAEEGVDGRPAGVLARAPAQLDKAVGQEHVVVRRRDENLSRLYHVAVAGVAHRQRTLVVEDLRHRLSARGRTCTTTNTDAERFPGSRRTSSFRTSIEPAEPPTTTMSRLRSGIIPRPA